MITLPTLALGGILSWFRKSLIGQIGAGLIVFLGVWKMNNMVVERKAVKRVVIESKKAGAKKNAKSRKIRNRIDGRTAMQRLRKDYADRQ